MSDSVRPHRRQPTRVLCPWDSPGKNTGVGCHFLLQCMKVKSESEVAQSCPTYLPRQETRVKNPSPTILEEVDIVFYGSNMNIIWVKNQPQDLCYFYASLCLHQMNFMLIKIPKPSSETPTVKKLPIFTFKEHLVYRIHKC